MGVNNYSALAVHACICSVLWVPAGNCQLHILFVHAAASQSLWNMNAVYDNQIQMQLEQSGKTSHLNVCTVLVLVIKLAKTSSMMLAYARHACQCACFEV